MKKTANPLRVGLIGAGHISTDYLRAARFFEQMTLAVCADLNAAAAEARAREFNIEFASIEGLLNDDSIELVLNLTTPQAHVPVALRAVEAGKHTYCEKPLGLSVTEAEPLLKAARSRGVRIGCAPDTFLGGGQQTARHLIDSGAIGTPIGGTAFILLPGHERWHPNPAFYYQPGGGPVFDMGPYYLTALVNLLGPIKRVVSCGRRTFSQRTIGSGPRQGESFPVEVQTHFGALLDFQSGPVVSFNASFDVKGHSNVPIEIYGTEGTLQVPDPNIFGGPVRLFEKNGKWRDVALTHGFGDRDYRGLGVAEMASAVASGKAHRASDTLAFHVLEVMEAIVNSGLNGEPKAIQSPGERPRPLGTGSSFGRTTLKEALIVWGGWEGHQPKQCAQVVTDLLKAEGLNVHVEDSASVFADPDLGRFDLIVPIVTQETISPEACKNLVATVTKGTGLAGFHGGMGDSFRAEPDYQFMVGGQWVAHPGNIISYRVMITKPDDPITRGVEDFDYQSEQYYMHIDPGNDVLATTTFGGEHCEWIEGVVMPVVWKRRHGAGKVFYCSLGHVAAEFEVAPMRTLILRGMLWAARDQARTN